MADGKLYGRIVTHVENGTQYIVDHIEVGNREGKSFYDVRYYSVIEIDGRPIANKNLPFNRPCSEFFDGRFEF